MSSNSNNAPLEDLQGFLQDFKDKYGGEVQIDSDFMQGPPEENQDDEESEWDLNFDYTPDQIKTKLDEYVIGQRQAKKRLANAVCYHYHQIEREDPFYEKKNILMIGNTGVGKTHLVEVLSEYIGVPFVKSDATKFSGTGYVGKNVNSLVRELVEKADNNLDRAEHGIVFIDEIDKICSSDNNGPDVSGRDVQTNLLKLLEETEISLMDPSSPMSMMKGMQGMLGTQDGDEKINTRKVLFIVSGAFPGLETIVGERLNRGGIGFNADVSRGRDLETLQHCTVEDLEDFGLESEFVGRLPIKTFLHDLDEDDMYRILTESQSSILNQFKRDFASYGIELDFTEEALRLIAEQATEHDIGARGLTTVLEDVLFEYMHELPSREITSLTVDESIVKSPKRQLYSLLLREDLGEYLNNLSDGGVEVTVNETGREALLDLALERNTSPVQLFQKRFDSIEHILKMVDCDRVEIDDYFVRNPEEELDKICSDHYQN